MLWMTGFDDPLFQINIVEQSARASLLTGLYSHQAGVGHMMENRGVPGYQGRLNDRGVLDNTLILFLSDNGGNAESGLRGPAGPARGAQLGTRGQRGPRKSFTA